MIPPGQTFWAVAPESVGAGGEREGELRRSLGRRFDSIRNIEFHPRDASYRIGLEADSKRRRRGTG